MGTAHQRLISVLVAAAAATACAGGTRLFKAATAPAAMQEQVCNLPVSDWRYASPGAVLAIAYEAIGFDGPKAIEMATAELRRLGLSEQGPDPDVVPLDWKNSNLHCAMKREAVVNLMIPIVPPVLHGYLRKTLVPFPAIGVLARKPSLESLVSLWV